VRLHPCKSRKTGRIFDSARKFAGVIGEKIRWIKYLFPIPQGARTGGPTAPCRGRNRPIRGQTGWGSFAIMVCDIDHCSKRLHTAGTTCGQDVRGQTPIRETSASRPPRGWPAKKPHGPVTQDLRQGRGRDTMEAGQVKAKSRQPWRNKRRRSDVLQDRGGNESPNHDASAATGN
jgi:hypothetical protein